MKPILKKIQDLIVATFSAEEITELNKLATPITVTLKEVTTKEGVKISFEGDTPAIGAAIKDAAGQSLADGSYTLEDGTLLTVVGGKISEVVNASTETTEQLAARKAAELAVPQIAQMSVQMSDLKKENDTLKTQLTNLVNENKKEINFLATQLKKILESEFTIPTVTTPVSIPDFSKMTAKDEAEWKRANGYK